MRQLLVALILTLSSLISTSLCASSATSFCKCTCKGNSTIIALNPKTPSFSSSSSPSNSPHLSLRRLLRRREKAPEIRQEAQGDGDENREKTHRANTCNDCNRKFCLDYNLPGCKGVREEEVFTTCFQRDSLKDEAVVIIFIFATAGLLLWALLKPYVQKWVVTTQERRTYVPLSSQGGGGGGGGGSPGDRNPT